MYVVGVDGCKGGWIAATYDRSDKHVEFKLHAEFSELVEAHAEAAAICVDIPIGLSIGDRRTCDIEARRLLKAPRASSVFSAPSRAVLGCRTWKEASDVSRGSCGRGLSMQSFGILPKIREVDLVMTPDLQHNVREVHPELCFWAMADGQPMQFKKSRRDGFDERKHLLETALNVQLPARADIARQVARVTGCKPAPDDVLDAIAGAWTAARIATKEACTIPSDPERDHRGLRMEMVY